MTSNLLDISWEILVYNYPEPLLPPLSSLFIQSSLWESSVLSKLFSTAPPHSWQLFLFVKLSCLHFQNQRHTSSFGHVLLCPCNSIASWIALITSWLLGPNVDYHLSSPSQLGPCYISEILSPALSLCLMKQGRMDMFWVPTIKQCHLMRPRKCCFFILAPALCYNILLEIQMGPIPIMFQG